MITTDQGVVALPAHLSHAQAVFLDECCRYLAFIADARRCEDAAYARWEDGRLDARHHNDARADYLRAADEAAYLWDRLDRHWARRSTVWPDPSSAPRTLYDALARYMPGAARDACSAGWLDALDSAAHTLDTRDARKSGQ